MNSAETAANYNAVPYPRFTFHQTHPNRLATIGHLMGMDVPDITQCRVLELGCAAGTNLLPMALQYPNSTFVGIDLSAVQIEDGRAMAQRLGIGDNLHLVVMDLLEVPADFGTFDYIIAHGLFSWVPEDVRHAILNIYKRHLSPNGIGYISYNTYPGWHITDSVRDLMRFHTRHISDPVERTNAAVDIVKWMLETVKDEQNQAYAALTDVFIHQLEDQLHRNTSRYFSSLLHDELSDVNQPFYFTEFIQLAQSHGLQYLAESHFASVLPSDFSPEVAVELNYMSGRDHLRREQYMDYLRNRRFRQTLVVHDDVQLQRSISPERLRGLYLTTKAEPDFEGDPHRLPTHYKTPRGMNFEVDNAATAAALVALYSTAPIALTVGEMLTTILDVLGMESLPIEAVNVLMVDLLQLFSIHEEFLTLRMWRPDLPTEVPATPEVWAVARLLVEDGDGHSVNLWHERVLINDMPKRLLPYVDGQHSYAALLEVMKGWYNDGTISIDEDHPSDDRVVYVLAKELDTVLHWYLINGLLVNPATA